MRNEVSVGDELESRNSEKKW